MYRNMPYMSQKDGLTIKGASGTRVKAPKRPIAKSLVSKAGKVPKRGKKSAKGKITPSKLKKELDRVFSLFIRAKYPKKCYTCGKVSDKLQNGHFVPRIYLATRWMESNCRPQCPGCNIWGRGQLLDFEENLKKELGIEKVEMIKQARHKLFKLDTAWYESQIDLYKQKLNALTIE